MIEYASSLKPILRELDESLDIMRPVLVVDHLIPLFQKHSPFEQINLYPIAANNIAGMHISSTERAVAHIFYHCCQVHPGETEMDRSCLGCQHERWIVTKELVHTMDSAEQKTHPDSMGEKLLGQLLKGDWDANHQVKADGMASIWAIELLARFCHRVVVTGNFGALPPSPALTAARDNDDFSYLAAQYAVPSGLLKLAFSERYLSSMRDIRLKFEMSLI